MCVSKAKQGVGGRRERWPAAKGKREQPTRWPAGKESEWKLWPMRFFLLLPLPLLMLQEVLDPAATGLGVGGVEGRPNLH